MRNSWKKNVWHRRVNWWEFFVGILLIILGITSLFHPSLTATGVMYAYGITGIIVGIADILLYIRVNRFTGFGPIVSLCAGALSVMSGVVILVNPEAGAAVFSVMFSMWFIAHCVSRLANLSLVRFAAGRVVYFVVLAINVLGILAGILLLASPAAAVLAAGYLAALYLIGLGAESILMAFLAL